MALKKVMAMPTFQLQMKFMVPVAEVAGINSNIAFFFSFFFSKWMAHNHSHNIDLKR
jgi:hypothetical protein